MKISNAPLLRRRALVMSKHPSEFKRISKEIDSLSSTELRGYIKRNLGNPVIEYVRDLRSSLGTSEPNFLRTLVAGVPNRCVMCGNPTSVDRKTGVPQTTCSHECSNANPARLSAIQATNLERYGSVCSLNGKEQIEAKKQTWLRNYGVDNVSKAQAIKKAKMLTTRSNYGCDNPAQNKSVVARMRKTRKANPNCDISGKMGASSKTLTLKGVDYSYRGHEHYCISYLVSNGWSVKPKGPAGLGITYTWANNKSHRYLPDIHAVKGNVERIIEVKSSYTLFGSRRGVNKNLLKRNLKKFDSAKTVTDKLGYEFWVVIVVTSKEGHKLLPVMYKGREAFLELMRQTVSSDIVSDKHVIASRLYQRLVERLV